MSEPSDLRIAGLVPLSSVDWPGHLVATVFCQGCPWRCPYCHNSDILDMRTPGVVPFSRVVDLLDRRHGLLDGVVFSGGEACAQDALVPAVREVRALGYAVGLHTSGAYPHRLFELADDLDWVGLDLKAMPDNYAQVAGPAVSGEKAWASARILSGAGIDTEVRVTVWPGGPRDVVDVVRAASDLGFSTFALQCARSTGAPSGFVADAPGWDEWVEERVEAIRALGVHVQKR